MKNTNFNKLLSSVLRIGKKSGQRIRLNTIDDALDQLEFLREKRAEYKKELKKVESKLKNNRKENSKTRRQNDGSLRKRLI